MQYIKFRKKIQLLKFKNTCFISRTTFSMWNAIFTCEMNHKIIDLIVLSSGEDKVLHIRMISICPPNWILPNIAVTEKNVSRTKIGLYMKRLNFILTFQFSSIERIIVQKTDLVIFVVFLGTKVFFQFFKFEGGGKGIIFRLGFIGFLGCATIWCFFGIIS